MSGKVTFKHTDIGLNYYGHMDDNNPTHKPGYIRKKNRLYYNPNTRTITRDEDWDRHHREDAKEAIFKTNYWGNEEEEDTNLTSLFEDDDDNNPLDDNFFDEPPNSSPPDEYFWKLFDEPPKSSLQDPQDQYFWKQPSPPRKTIEELYFCKKCYNEALDISTGRCTNCGHIYGMFSTCPWCEPGKINESGQCNNCEFKLYEPPHTNHHYDANREYISFDFNQHSMDSENSDEFEPLIPLESSEDERNIICPLCGYDNNTSLSVYDNDNEGWCDNCRFWLSNQCPKCKTTLRFETNDEDLEEECWQCKEPLTNMT